MKKLKKEFFIRELSPSDLEGGLKIISERLFGPYKKEYEDVIIRVDNFTSYGGSVCLKLIGIREETDKEFEQRIKVEKAKKKKKEEHQRARDKMDLERLLKKYPDGLKDFKEYDKPA